MRRATNDAQKEQRRQAILDTAWSLFQAEPYDAVSISEVAQRAGLAKGTIFLYFKTKEELFLAIQEQQFLDWFEQVDAQLEALGQARPIPEVARLIADSLSSRPALTRLFAILHTTLERNIEYEAARHFKRLLLERITRTGTLLERTLPFLGEGDGAALLMRAYALVIGIQHLADPAPVVREVLRDESEMAVFEIDFAQEFLTTFTYLLYGTETQNRSDEP